MLIGDGVSASHSQLRQAPVLARILGLTFTYAAAATDALAWITLTRPPGATGYAIAVAALITVFIAAIAVRTIVALARGRLLPSS